MELSFTGVPHGLGQDQDFAAEAAWRRCVHGPFGSCVPTQKIYCHFLSPLCLSVSLAHNDHLLNCYPVLFDSNATAKSEELMAALIDAIDIKRKMFFEFENTPFHCLEVEVSTPTARGGQTLVRIKMRNLITRAVFDKTFKASDKFKEPDLQMVPGLLPVQRQRWRSLSRPGKLRDAQAFQRDDWRCNATFWWKSWLSNCISTTAIPLACSCRRMWR